MIASTQGTFGWAGTVFAALGGEVIAATLDAASPMTAKPSSMVVFLAVVTLRWNPIDLVRFFDFNQSMEKR